MTQKCAMTSECYAEIKMGAEICDVQKKCGKPYAIHTEGKATDVYEYIENVYQSTTVVQTRRYYLYVSNGKVVGKHIRYTRTPAVFSGMFPETPYPNY